MNRRIISMILSLLFVFTTISPSAFAAEEVISIYVSPLGNDSASGSIDNPLKTLDGARARVRQLRESGIYVSEVIFRGGDYHMRTVNFTIDDSGTEKHPIIYKAYEDITGEDLSEEAKIAAAEELIVTGELADLIGSEEATQIVNELKKILDETQTMSDEEVRSEIRRIADEYNVEISDEQIGQLLKLVRSLEGLDVDQLKERITGFANTLETANKVSETVTKVGEKIGNFFKSVGNFFKTLFS